MLPAGDHILVVYPSTAASTPYALIATQVDLASADPEPNGDPTVAVPLDPAHMVVRGRLTTGDLKDWYSLDIDDQLAGVAARHPPHLARRTRAAPLRGGRHGRRAAVPDRGRRRVALGAPPAAGAHHPGGESGDPSASATYLLRIDATTAPAADFESEPNDDPQTA